MHNEQRRGARSGLARSTVPALLTTMTAAAVPMLLASASAAAQASPQTRSGTAEPRQELEEIVVTGIRETFQTSISEKREEIAIVDALSSQDVGDLPALSVGEAIQTITGATTHREKGGASEIAIRGLGPFLANATFNGREATNGSGDRSVNFNQFPSELINGVKIYKTQQANLVEGGVAGTIELETLKPLDYGEQRFQTEAKANYNAYQDRVDGSSAWGWRGTMSYVDQFDAGALGDIGVSLGFQRNDVNNPEETVAGSSTWVACDATAAESGNCPEVSRADGAAGAPFYLAPNSLTWRQISENDERDAFFGAVQWRPGDRFDVNLDVQYSDRTFVEDRHDLNFSEMRRGHGERIISEAGYPVYLAGESSLESTSTLQERAEEYTGGGLNVDFQASDRLSLNADLAYSHTKRVQIDRSTRLRSDGLDIFGDPTALGEQRVPYIYDVRNGFAPSIIVDPRFDITDWSLFSDDARLRRDQEQRENEIWAARFDLKYDLDGAVLSGLDAGVRYSQLTYEDFDDRVEITQDDREVDRAANLACRTAFPQSDFLDEAPGNNIMSWATFDSLCLFREYLGTSDPGRNPDVRSVSNRDVEEDVWAAYVMATYDSMLGDLPVRGNFGVRAVNTSVASFGLRSALDVVTNPDGTIQLVEGGGFETVAIEHETTRWLPSVNAIFDLHPDVMLRLSTYRAMSRPAPASLGAGREIELEDGASFTSIEEAIAEISANGSPRLEPLMSWNFDASLEWYPNADSLLAGAVYYKRFSGGFIPVVLDEEFVIDGETVTIPVAQTRNDDNKSRIYGFELTVANRFSWLPSPWDGLGVKVSYNYADSDFETHDIRLGDVLDPVTGEVTPGIIPPAGIFGFSKHVLSTQAYYEIGGLSLQGVFNYRSGYYQDFVGGNRQLRYVRDNETVDLRASYAINDSISVRLEALNVFDEPKITDMPVEGSIRQYHYYGAKYFFGVRMEF